MIFSKLILTATAMLQLANGLNKELRELAAKWNPEDPFNDVWQNELYETTLKIGDAETFL